MAAPIDRIPLFVKAGSIVPLGADIASTATKQAIVELKIYPGANATFRLYDDDGRTYGYETGKNTTTTTLTWDDARGRLSAAGDDKVLIKAAPGLVRVVGK